MGSKEEKKGVKKSHGKKAEIERGQRSHESHRVKQCEIAYSAETISHKKTKTEKFNIGTLTL